MPGTTTMPQLRTRHAEPNGGKQRALQELCRAKYPPKMQSEVKVGIGKELARASTKMN